MIKENRLEEAVKNLVGQAIVKEVMSLKLAIKLMEAVEEQAKEMGLAVVIAVSDASGRPVAVHCMDGAYHGSFDVAVNKAYTSTAFQMATSRLSRLCQPGGELYGLQFGSGGKIMILGGGEPLMVGETMIGALAVSGGSAAQDTELAAYGRNVLKEVIKCL
ncbi:MAG: heme-binding protein [Lachnospiraceae bacterium]